MRVGGGDAERLRVSRPPPHPSRPSVVPPYPFWPTAISRSPLSRYARHLPLIRGVGPLTGGTGLPPCGGKAWGPFKWGGIWSFVGRLDTYIGNWGEVRLLEGGRPSVPPLRRKRGKPGRRAESSRPAEWSAGDGRVRTPAPTGIVGEKRRAHNVCPYSAIINGSAHKKRDRF